MQNKTKIKTYKLPYNFFIRDNFFNKKNLSNLLLLRNELYNSAEDVGKSLKNKRLSKKRKVIRFVNHNKLNVNKRNKNYIILKDIHKSIKKKINKKLFSDLQINPDLINKGFLNLTLTWDNRG